MPKVTMPQLGESVAEGTIGKWLKQVGDPVAKYEPIVEVITDKVNAEVPSPFEGTLTEILVQEGETVPNNAEIAVIEAVGAAASAADAADPSAEADTNAGAAAAGTVTPEGAGEAAGAGPNVEQAEGQEPRPTPTPAVGAATATASPAGGNGRAAEPTILGTGAHGPAGSDERSAEASRPAASAATEAPPEYEGRVTPAVRRLAREHGIDLNQVTGTGHAGRVTREDVLAFVEQQRTGAAAPAETASTAPTPAFQPTQTPAAAATTGPAPAPAGATAPAPAAPSAPGQDELKPTTPMRKAIAAHMSKAKQTAPHAYTTVEVDMSGVLALREAKKREYEAREGTSLSFVAIVGKAVVEALKKHRDLNAHWTDDGLLRKADINLGIAVAVDDGLVVPVVKRADEFSIHGLNLHIQDFAARARANRLKLDDVQGGTFTLNNTGWFGSVASQPIINVPEIAILSMEAIIKRPVVIETAQGDTIGIRPIMNVCVSFDHRGTDGAQVGRFVQDVRRFLESVDANTAIW